MGPAALTIYYDGNCRICTEQKARFDRLDGGRGLLLQVDFNDPEFDPASIGQTPETMGTNIRAKTPEGEMLEGMDVIRAAYRAVGRGWMVAPTGWPGLRPVFDALYRRLARNRYRFGRVCEDGACRIGE